MTHPAVSVIIPAQNEQILVAKCLISFLEQKDAPSFEIILVDNNSTDKTATIAKSLGVRVLHEPRPGAAHARNSGAKNARGDILIFADADCIASPKHIAKIHQWFSRDTRRKAVAGGYYYYDAPAWIRWSTVRMRLYPMYYGLLRRLFGVQVILGGNFAIRKDTFTQVGGYDEQLSHMKSDDTDLAVRLHKMGTTVLFLPSMTVRSSYRRMHNFRISDQMSRLSSHYGLLLRYSLKRITG